MKYIELGATYKVKIPDDLVWDENPSGVGFTLDDYRDFWHNHAKEITITMVTGPSQRNIYGTVAGRCGTSSIEKEWVGELVRHCPQVEHYIKSQQKEKYISPITGKKS